MRLPRVRIEDSPRYGWRGLSLDVARHFFGPEEIRRVIDLLAFHKLNRLHLHLTDDQGWRLEIQSWPNLTQIGGSTQVGGGPGGFYTQAQFRELVGYAAERFVSIVPEIDMPGHTNAALSAYPELNPDGVAPPAYTGTEVGFSSLWLGSEITARFVADVLGEVAALTPGAFIHIGGDEAHNATEADYRAFIELAQSTVSSLGKTLVGWCEVVQAPIAPGSVAQYWHPDACGDLSAVNAQDLQVVVSPADRAYLDMKYDEETPLGLDWAGLVDVERAYDWNPEIGGVSAERVLGVEAALWTETIITRDHMDLMMFPRLAGHAEIGWSAQERREFEEYRVRLALHGRRLSALGVAFYRSPQVPWAPAP
jgi:hexosaminidase